MPGECSICSRRDRDAINAAIVEHSESLRDIAGRFGTTKSTLARHAADHIPKALTASQRAVEVAAADTLLSKVSALENNAQRLGLMAERGGDLRTALSAVAQLVKIVELLAKLSGELGDGGTAISVQVAAGLTAGLTPTQMDQVLVRYIEKLDPQNRAPADRLRMADALREALARFESAPLETA